MFQQPDFIQRKIDEITKFIDSGIPVLLIGPTGCGKTTIAEKIFENRGDYLKFNFSSETTIDQLLGNLSLDKDSNPKFDYGMYSFAYKEGMPLILDEFNLAHEDVLQCIESSLDTEELFVDDPDLNNSPIKMHENFKLIATQNDSDSAFASMRNKLTSKLTSHFQVIEFNNFDDDELTALCSKFNKNISTDEIEKVIDFHYSCSSVSNKDYNFTIRNLKMALLSTDGPQNLYRSLFYYYQSLLGLEKSNIIADKLNECNIHPSNEPELDVYQLFEQKQIRNVWKNDVLTNTLRKIHFFMDNNQPILIVGSDGSGKTQIAKWATKLFKHRDAYFMICHPEMTTSDIVGCYTTSNKTIAEWKDGPIVKAAKEGRALIIDQLENASPQVIERINPILDAYSNVLLNKRTGSHNSTRFSVTECFEGLEVEITDHFQIIATVTKNQLKNLSPALKNRFTIIEIDSQIDPSNAQEQVKELINALLETKQGNQISFSENLINEIIKIDGISNISKIVNGLRIICTKYPNFNSDSAQRAIFNALKEIYIDHKTPELHESIREVIISKITGPTTGFYFKNSPELENIVSLIILMQNIGQHIVLQSGTGFGKTSAAVSLAKGLNFNAFKVSFNAETKLSDLIGNITISRGKSDNSKGQLLKAIKEGGFFIADEANLAEINVLQSLIIALEQKPGESIEIPSEGTTKIHEKYFFIVCQNDNTMFGRKPLPQVLLKRVVCFDYPFPINSIKEVIKEITSEYNLSMLNNVLTNFVININRKFQENDKIRPWSFREVRRFCRRVSYSETIEFLQNNDEWNKISAAPSAMMHALFMSWMMCPDPEKSIKTICQVVGESFGYTDIDNLVQILSTNAYPKDNYVIKGILRIKSVVNFENSKRVPKSISSFWNAVFLASLVPPTDPLLIVGESSFKTFLANSITVDPSQVTLGSETTTASLIGQVSYVRQQTYERTMLDLLHTIMISNEKLYPKFTDFKKNFVRNKENLDKLVEFTKQIDVPYLKKSIDYITKQLIADEPDQSTVNPAISNYTTVFKPGLITHYLFRQSPIIIKNFSKPPTSVIERFNELLSIEPELTLTEDYTNTITPPNDKTIKINPDAKNRFRIIALSSLNDYNRISEAMKSRFNIISIEPYTVEEKQTITGLSNKYVKDPNFHMHKLILMQSIIDQIKTIHTNISNSHEEIPREELEKLAAKILGAEENEEIENSTDNEFQTPLKVDDGYLKSDNPYILSYSAPYADPTKTNIVFTRTTQTMCDRIFTALSLDIPIIIQGPTGTCKSMLADYVANLMKDFTNNNHVIKIQLSRSTTVEDLFGRNSIKVDINGNKTFDYIPTELFKAASESSHRSLIIIEELNLASPSLIDALSSLFDNNPETKIMKTNGESEKKGRFSIIGIASGNVPPALKKSAIFFRRDEYAVHEMRAVCESILKKSHYVENLVKYFETKNPRNCQLYSQLEDVFKDSHNALLQEISSKDSKNKQEWSSIEIAHESVGSTLKVGRDLEIQVSTTTRESNFDFRMQKQLMTLTPSEQKLFVCLAANKIKRYPLIVTGGTASGKTYTVRLFAQAINKKLIVIPVNADTSISTITGSYKPSKYVSKQNIQKIINKLSEDPAFNELSRMLLETAKSHIEVSELKDFASDIDTILKESNDRNTIKIGEEAKTIISTAAHLINNIEYAESGLITAMKNGYWVLFDGVESCPSNILERIITLLDFEPSLNLYEVDEGITYSTKSQNLIHDDFRIIITYNDVGTHKKTPLPQTILSRCAILRMDPIDIDPRTVAEISLFNVPDVDYILADQNVIDKIELVTRIGNCHCYIRNQQLEENPNGSSYEITGRSILRICKLLNYFCNISRNGEVDYNQIKRALTITYNKNFNEIDNDENQLNQSIYSSFLQDPDKDFITNLTQLYYKQVIDRNKLNGLIEERVRSDQPIINVFYVIERALFEDIFNLVDFLNELVKDFKSATKQNWLIDYVYLQRLTDIVERLTELKDETKDDIKSLTLTNSLKSKDPKLKEILAEFSFLCQTYPTYEGITLPAQFASERFVLDSISNEIKINVFRYPNLYFNFPKIKEISQFFDGIFKHIFEAYIICYENQNLELLKLLNKLTSMIFKKDLMPSRTVEIFDLVNSFKDSSNELYSIDLLVKSFKQYDFGLPKGFLEILRSLQDEYNKKNINSEDERKWFNLKEIHRDLSSLFDLTEKIGWVPVDIDQEEVIKQAKSISTVSYDKFASYVTKTDPNNNDQTDWFKALMDFSYDMHHYDNLLNPRSCISSLLALHNRGYKVGDILKLYNGISFTMNITDSNALLFDIFDKYLTAMYDADKKLLNVDNSLLNVNNLIAKVNSYINQKEHPSSNWYDFIVNNNKKYDINLPIRIPYFPERSLLKICSKIYNFNFRTVKELKNYMKEPHERNQYYENMIAKATSYNYDISDILPFETKKEIVSYVDEFPAQGLFLIRNTDFYKLLDKSKKELTYGTFMIRIVSSFKQIVFETDKFTYEMKESINNSIQKLLSEKENKKSIIVSLALSNPPYCFKKFFTCLLHDSILQAATYKTDDQYVRQTNMFIGDYLLHCLKQYSPLTKEKWDSFIGEQTFCLLNPIGEYINFSMRNLNQKVSELIETKIKSEKVMKGREKEIKELLPQLEKAMMIDDPMRFMNQFKPENDTKDVIDAYEQYSICIKSILNEMTEFNWNSNLEQIKLYPNTQELYKFLNRLDSNTSTNFQDEIGVIYIHNWKSNTISFRNKNNPDIGVTYSIKPNTDTFMVVPNKFIKDLQLSDPLRLFTIKISKFANKDTEISLDMLFYVWNKFDKIIKRNPKALDNYRDAESPVIFVSNDKEYTFNDLSEFITNKQSGVCYLDEFRNKFTNPQYKMNPNMLPSNTKSVLNYLEMKIQDHDRCVENLNNALDNIANFPSKRFIPPSASDNKPNPNLRMAQKIKVDFTQADNSVFNMAAINVQGESVIPTFSSIKADVPGILRGIQTTPICIPVYVFGNVSNVTIEFHPTSQETPIPTYEVKESQINLIFPINDIIQDITFTGTMDIGTKTIDYEVSAHFIDSYVFIDSPGNKFINGNDGITFDKDFIAEDNITILPTIPGEANPRQTILVENVNCQLPESPIQLKDNDKTIVFQKSFKDYLIKGITLNLYHTPLENSQVKINTPVFACNRKVFFNSLSPPYQIISEKKEIEIGYTYNKYFFIVSYFMRYKEEPKIKIKGSDNVSLINQKNTPYLTSHEASYIIEVDIKSIAHNRNEKSMLEISIDGQQFQWSEEIKLKVISPLRGNYLSFGTCNCYCNDISYSLCYNDQILPHAFYANEGFGTILTTNEIRALSILDKKPEISGFKKELKDMNLLVFVSDRKNSLDLWIPASIPELGKISALIKEMSENDLRYLLAKLEQFFGKEEINTILNKVKNFPREQDRTLSIREFIVKTMKNKFDKLIKDDFQLTIDDSFNIKDVNNNRNINVNMTPLMNQKLSNEKELKNMTPKFVSDQNTTIVTEFKSDSLQKLTFDTRIINLQQKQEMLQEINRKLEETNEPKLELIMIPNNEEFDQEKIFFKNLTSAKAIYEKISQILYRCRKFILIMSNYKDYTKGFPASNAEEEIRSLAAFYDWSSNKDTLRTTPFLTQCIEFNHNFISLFKILTKSGCQIQNLEIKESDDENSDHIQYIVKPTQPLISVEEFKKEWRRITKKLVFNTKSITLPQTIYQEKKQKQKNQEQFNVGSNASVIPRKEFTNQIGLNSQQGRGTVKDEDAYKYMIDNIDKQQKYADDLESRPGLGIAEIDDIPEENELPIDKFIDYATETTFNIVNYANKVQINTNSQIVLLLDIKSITPEEIKRDNLLYFVAFAMACSHLGLDFRLAVFADREFQYLEIKKLSEKLQRKHLQVALETFDTKRLSSDPFIAIRKIINKDVKSSYSFFVFSDGNLLNTTTISWPRWDKNTNSTITWFIQPPEEYKVPIVNQYIKLSEEYDNMFYQTNTVQESGFDKCEKYIVAFFKGFSKENLENKEKSITMTLSENKINVTCSFKSIKCTDNQFVCVSENLQTSMARICEVTDTNELDYIPRSNDSKFGLEVFERNITHNFNPEEMFIPNKAMQYIASEKGSGISMPGLIRFIITDGQDQRFRLEKSAGYVPSYSLFFVIDCAESSSGMLSIKSTVLTVFSTMIAFKECNSPITVILATSTGPVAVCINKKKEDIFVENSPVFTEIYRLLTTQGRQTQTAFRFSQALTAAYNIRCRQQEQESILIAITSAHFYQTEMEAVGTCISTLQSLKTSTIGVGVGICPKNISKVFSKSVWSDNPLKISECFNKLSKLDTSEAITEGKITFPVLPEKVSLQELDAQLHNKDNRVFTNLTDRLEKIQMFDAAIGYFINEKAELVNVAATQQGANNKKYKGDLPDEDLGRNAKWPYKILICQLYDATVNQDGAQNEQEPNPPPQSAPDQIYLPQNRGAPPPLIRAPPPLIRTPPKGKQTPPKGKQTSTKGKQTSTKGKPAPPKGNQFIDRTVTYETLNDQKGIIERLRNLGFTVKVSQNYCNCIAEILSGQYHQVWVICSNGQEAKPSDAPVDPDIKKAADQIRGDTSDFSHAYQFVETVEQFRMKGGGVSFWADQGFTFELDYYLEHLKLYDCDVLEQNSDKVKEPVKLRFDGQDPVRGQTLNRKTPATFQKKSFDSEDCKQIANYRYYLYGYNVLELKEGTTIAGAKIPDGMNYEEICEYIKPFRPFSLSSDEGLVSGCYYIAPKYSNEGDIIIDGAASRLFKELNLEGVKRLVRNMAVCLVNKWRTIAETGHYQDMQPISGIELPPIPKDEPVPMRHFKPIDLVFIYDATKSTEKIRDLIKFQIKNAIEWFKAKKSDVKIALIAFRDLIYAKKLNKSINKNDTEYINFLSIDGVDELVSEIEYIPCQGGMGDGPEDWNSAFKAYFKLDFRKEASQIIFFITDNGAHHPEFHSHPDNEIAAKLFAEGKSNFQTDDEKYSIDDFIGPNEILTQKDQLEVYIKQLAKQNPLWILCPFGYHAFYPMEKLYRKLKNNNPSTNCINITFKGYCPKKRLEHLNKDFYKIIDIESDATSRNSRTDLLENLSPQDLGKIFEEIFTQTKLFIEKATMF